MKKIIMYGHGGSENHGCEAIVRSTIKLLGNNQYYLISSQPAEDIRYGLDKICKLLPEKNNIHKNDFEFIKALFNLKIKKDYVSMDKLQYKDAFKNMSLGDIALSIGGDNYCYADVGRYIMMHELAMKRGAVTVLWGCSIEPNLLNNKSISSDLSKYTYIIARESITYEAVKKINPNTVFMPDTAFLLEKEKYMLPTQFIPGNTVGINISPMVIKNEKKPGSVMNNYVTLMDYIINNTNLNIALIPHVVWDESNDNTVLKELYEKYMNTNRVVLINNQSCCRLKYAISQCRYFIGARTHSTIAAYSSNVPTIVVGYSVKASGIAKDIFGSGDNYTIDSSKLIDDDQLLGQFKKILNNSDNIVKQLKNYNKTLFSKYNEVHKIEVFFGE